MNELDKVINDIIKGISSPELNIARAKSFKKFTQQKLRLGDLGLKQNKPATIKIQGGVHPPMHFTGRVNRAMKIKIRPDKSVDAGYFMGDSTKPSGSKISFAKIVKIQACGFRIPLTGGKGEKVRRWLAAHGIFPRKTRSFLVVAPRPFILNSINMYKERKKDDIIIIQKVKQLWKSL